MGNLIGVLVVVALALFSILGPLFAISLVARAHDDRWKWALLPFVFTPAIAPCGVVRWGHFAGPWLLALQCASVVILALLLRGHRRLALVCGLLAALASILFSTVVSSTFGGIACGHRY